MLSVPTHHQLYEVLPKLYILPLQPFVSCYVSGASVVSAETTTQILWDYVCIHRIHLVMYKPFVLVVLLTKLWCAAILGNLIHVRRDAQTAAKAILSL